MIKQFLGLITAAMILVACQKNSQPAPAAWENYLATQLSSADFARIDKSTLHENDRIIRMKLLHSQEMIVLAKSADGSITGGKILQVDGSIDQKGYQGSIVVSDLNRSNQVSSIIQNGFILSAHTTYIAGSSTTRTASVECRDCTIPEVIVTTSYSNAYNYDYDPFAWINLFWLMGGDIPKTEYMPLDGGGGGGDASTSIDTEEAENREKIDAKKFMDCFDQIADAGATCTITISTDIPVDNRPDQFFDPAAGSVGHAFIELWKMSPGGQLVSQTIGFYPSGSFKAATGINVESKIVDNAFHEYNARYTIAVTPAQLRAATMQVRSLDNTPYNLSGYNCTDFALSVFNAAGGGLTIPKYQIPAYGSSMGSNTPQGLYQQLMTMAAAGNAGVQTNGAKGYAGSSHGPCN